jgi:hypothetical protein
MTRRSRFPRPARRPYRVPVLWIAPSLALVMAAALLLALVASAAPKKNREGDTVWTSTEISKLSLGGVAMLPVMSYDNDIQKERQVESAWAQAFVGTGYRWVSGTTARDNLRRDATGDSLWTLAKQGMLRNARVDSLAAQALCARLRTQAVLSVRIDLWDRQSLEPEQAGKPTTTVQMHAALVDSTGRLVWSASGSETAEGAYHDAVIGTPDERGSNALHGSGGGGAEGPLPGEVAQRIAQRWAPLFPKRPSAAAAQP